MHYTLHQLRVFLKVFETKSITKAAEELHLTQPAVSIQLKKLQEQFEVPLTEVVGRQLYITEFGREIAEASQRIMEEVHAIKYKTMAYRGQLVGQLKVSVVSTGKYVMPYFLSDFMSRHPGVDLVMDVTNKGRVVEHLEKNEVDFALVSVLPENLQLERVELMENRLYLVGKNFPEGKKKIYDKKIFEELPMLFREPGSATRYAMEQYIARHSLQVDFKMALTSNEATKQAVMAGLGYSVMPLIGIKNELSNGSLNIIPVKGFPVVTHWNLVWLRQKTLSPVARSYLDYISSEKNELIERSFNWTSKY